jgi:hypothetical protein
MDPRNHLRIIFLDQREIVFVDVPGRLADKNLNDKNLAEAWKINWPVSCIRNTACEINCAADLQIMSPANANTSFGMICKKNIDCELFSQSFT